MAAVGKKKMKATSYRAMEMGVTGCPTCRLVVKLPSEGVSFCPRCSNKLRFRKYNSVRYTWALLISALIMYIPANIEPIMYTTSFGDERADTILGGVLYFLEDGDWPLALIIFVASVLLPLLKIFSISYLLISVNREMVKRRVENTRLYRLAELVGRWSMLDVFVVGIMVTLVKLESFSIVIPGVGAASFASVVVLTLLATRSFDPRLIWDRKKIPDNV